MPRVKLGELFSMSRCKRAGLGIVAVLGLASGAQAQLYGDFKLDPKTYASPSGEVTLFVDPSQPSTPGARSWIHRSKAPRTAAGSDTWPWIT